MLRLIPGTVVEQMIGADAIVSPAMVAELKRFFGLDRPWYAQYGSWLAGLARGDLGTSWRTGKPVVQLIFERLPVTLELTGLAVGLRARARHRGRHRLRHPPGRGHRQRHACRHAPRPLDSRVLAGHDADPLLLALPALDAAGGLGRLLHRSPAEPHHHAAARPSVSGRRARPTSRAPRAPACSTCSAPSTSARRRPRGWPAALVLKHALKNALIPVVTVAGLQIGILLGGTVVVEEVFTLPGVGRLVLWSIYQRDYPLTQSTILFIALMFMTINLHRRSAVRVPGSADPLRQLTSARRVGRQVSGWRPGTRPPVRAFTEQLSVSASASAVRPTFRRSRIFWTSSAGPRRMW